MANLRIENNFIGGTPQVKYKKNDVDQPPVSSSPVDVTCDYSTDAYRFRIDGNRNAGNAILFAHKDFTHCIEIIDTDGSQPHPVKIRIAPYPAFAAGDPDLKVSANRMFTPAIEPRGTRYIPKKIGYEFKDEINSKLVVNVNSMIKTYSPSPANSGTINEYLGDNGIAEFQVIDTMINNYWFFLISSG